MEIVTLEEINSVRERFSAFTEEEIRRLMKTFEKKQTALLVYIAAVAEREELNEEEYDVLISTSLLIWQTMADKFPDLRKVAVERVEELDNRMFETLESMLKKSDESHEKSIQRMIEAHKQPNLLGTISEMSIDTETAVRDELKGILFFTAKNVLDALVEASS